MATAAQAVCESMFETALALLRVVAAHPMPMMPELETFPAARLRPTLHIKH